MNSQKRIGYETCINTIGIDYYNKYKANSVFGYTENDDGSFSCFMGIDDEKNDTIGILTHENNWKYYVKCLVKEDKVVITESKIPDTSGNYQM